jgi:hypothetical protein
MTTLTMLIGLATLGVETGWQPVADGELEYIIQIEPPLLDALQNGESIISEIPAKLKGVRRYKIVVGKAPLPRSPLPVTAASVPAAAPSIGSPTASPPAAVSPRDTSPPSSPPTGRPPEQSLPDGSPAASVPPAGVPMFPSAPPADAAGAPPAGSAAPPPPAGAATAGPDRYGAPSSPAGLPEPPPAGRYLAPAGSAGGPATPPAVPSETSSTPAAPGGVSFPLGGSGPPGGATAAPSTAPTGGGGAGGSGSSLPPPPETDIPKAAASPSPLQPDPQAAELTGAQVAIPAQDPSASDQPAATSGSEPAKPWLPLTMTIVGLFASIGGNLYLGWVAWDARHHYRKLVHQMVGYEATNVIEVSEEDGPLVVGDGTTTAAL